ncbi:MAG TPA: HU family DNA-binding protein [Armatimonadota bacterium]|jgi:DNA-binding protein HU-beta
MTKPELISAVAARTGKTKNVTAMMVDAVLDTITDTLSNKEQVSLVGFGTFDVRTRGERPGRNPRTAEKITIPASTVCVFRTGRRLRDAVGQ